MEEHNMQLTSSYAKKKINDKDFKEILFDFEKSFKKGEIPDIKTTHLSPGKTGEANGATNSFKLGNEIDWFGFQTHIRKIVYELVEPTVKRALSSEV